MLEQIVGNTILKENLQIALKANRLGHSVLLCGEDGLGRGFAARALAAEYLYPNGGSGAAQVMAGTSPECVTITGEGASGQIRVEAIRKMRLDIFETALSAQGRVVIIKDAQNLNQNSANALLKILEEPPESVLFILTANSPAALLLTIRSRCNCYSLMPPTVSQCIAWLQSYAKNQRDISLLATVYNGRIGSCKAVCDSSSRRQLLEKALKAVEAVNMADTYTLLCMFAQLEKDKQQVLLLLQDMIDICAAGLLGQTAVGLCQITSAAAAKIIPLLNDAALQINANANLKLVLSVLAGALCNSVILSA
ncbi:MAG: AAA family ATPase [Oscillospiraceae bacterium]|nr:AAA family ATPase [Oscillospiraceae bacterium]